MPWRVGERGNKDLCRFFDPHAELEESDRNDKQAVVRRRIRTINLIKPIKIFIPHKTPTLAKG